MKLSWLVAIVILAVDQALKSYFLATGIKVSLNNGMAFGLASGKSLTFVIGAVLVWVIIKSGKSFWWWLILSGGLSNYIDRLIHGAVIDYIHMPYLPAFNISDLAIVSGIIGVIYENRNR